MSFLESLKRLFGRGSGVPAESESGSAAAMIPCEEAAARLFEYLDGELERVSEDEVRAHLDACEYCYPRVQFEKHFLDALQRSQNGGRVSDDLRARVLQSLTEDERPD